MKKLNLIIGILFLLPIFAKAQYKEPTVEEIAKKNVDELETRLKLNATQKNVIYAFAFTQAKEQAKLIKIARTEGYTNEIGDKMYKIQNETNKNIRLILKPEQLPEFEKVLEERSNGTNTQKKKKKKNNEEEEKVVGIEGLKEN
ncbi:MAG: hypothetical protein K2Q03_06245 [Sphingobacteriaceae bacterium]|nr:hypothetical protein [Sphingobacteriaceae bacterium]